MDQFSLELPGVEFYEFAEILPLMKTGKTFRRKNWTSIYIAIEFDEMVIKHVGDKHFSQKYVAYNHDVMANDWVPTEPQTSQDNLHAVHIPTMPLSKAAQEYAKSQGLL